jgi:hypothetical protein
MTHPVKRASLTINFSCTTSRGFLCSFCARAVRRYHLNLFGCDGALVQSYETERILNSAVNVLNSVGGLSAQNSFPYSLRSPHHLPG